MSGHVPLTSEVVSLYSVPKKVGLTAVAGSAALILAACGSSGSGGSSSSGSSGGSGKVPQLSVSQLNNSF